MSSQFAWWFHVLNGLVTGVACVYGVRRYILSSVQKQQQDQENELRNLRKERKRVQHEQSAIAAQIEQQKRYNKRLLVHLTNWKHHVLQHKKNLDKDRTKRRLAFEDRVKKQYAYLAEQQAQRIVFKEVFLHVRKELDRRCAHKEVQKAFLDASLQCMRGR